MSSLFEPTNFSCYPGTCQCQNGSDFVPVLYYGYSASVPLAHLQRTPSVIDNKLKSSVVENTGLC